MAIFLHLHLLHLHLLNLHLLHLQPSNSVRGSVDKPEVRLAPGSVQLYSGVVYRVS